MMQVHSSREVEGLLATLNAKMCESVELQEQNSRAAISLQLLQARPPARSGSRTDGRAAIDRTDRLRAAAAQRRASVRSVGAR